MILLMYMVIQTESSYVMCVIKLLEPKEVSCFTNVNTMKDSASVGNIRRVYVILEMTFVGLPTMEISNISEST